MPLLLGLGLATWSVAGHAQSSMLTVCKQYNARGTMACDARPSGFSDWVYRTGYGEPASTESQSAANAMNYFTGQRPVCSASYSLGPQTVLILDDFAASRQPLRTSRTTTMPTARLTWNAQDDIVQASDFKGVTTRYARDAQGNATAEASPDIGSIRTQYDALGLPASIVDAMGQATNITSDLLGRPTVITFADGKTTTLRYDLTASSKGYLSEITDRSGTTQYTRDAFGRVTLKRQILASGLTQQVGYAYAANGLLSAISYPNGKVLGYRYDATGRLTQLDVDGQPVLASLAWNPMGQPTGWNWAFVSTALNASRQYDTAGQLVATEFSKYIYDAAGRMTNVAQDLIRPSDADPTHSTLTGYVGIWNVAYDPVGRITGFNSNTDKNAFGYDANGNRTSSTRTVNGQTTTRTYAVEGPSNRLLGFGQTQGATSTNVAYGYNANGDLTSDGLKSFSYNAEGRLSAVTTGATDTSPTTRYAHNALGQRVFKTEPLFPPAPGDEANPSFMQSLIAFFTKMWAPSSTDAEKLGFAFMYDEEGNLLSETGTGGANSTGSTMHIYLPTATGAMPVAAIVNGQMFAVHSDHLNTPRKITNASGQVVWQWAYSPFGEDEPTTAAKRFTSANTTPTNGATSISPITYNLRYWGMQGDTESGLFYNGFRSYKPGVGYTQNDPIGLASGLNRKTTLENNPLKYSDPSGLFAILPPIVPPPGNFTPVPGGAPPSIDPGNPFVRGAPPSAGPRAPSFTLSGTPGLIAQGCSALADWMFSDTSASKGTRPTGVPESWGATPSRDGKGTKWVDPSNPRGGDYVRERDDGTLTQVKNGRALDANGNPASGLSSPEAHFPRDQWQFRP